MSQKSLLLSEDSNQARRVRQARNQIHAGFDPDLSFVRPLISESWRRSRFAGVSTSWGAGAALPDPHIAAPPMPIPTAEVKDQRLVEASTPVMQLLSEALSDRASVLMLTDRSCRTVQWTPSSCDAVNREAEFVIDAAGGWWPEERVGTDAVALCHFLGEPVQVHWYEHYTEGLDNWTGAACPIRDLVTREVIGTINIFAFRCIGHPQALELAQKAATFIERQLTLGEQHCRMHLLETYDAHIWRYPDNPVVCLTQQGVIVGITPAARASLRVKGTDVRGRLLSSLPGIRLYGAAADLASVTRAQSVDLRFGDDCIAAEIEPILHQSDVTGFLLTLKPPKASRGRFAAVNHNAWQANHRFDQVIGQSNALRKTITSARQIAKRDDAVLIFGETGTGKELMAHAIHAESARSSGPFIPLNCGGMGGELLRAELFGYEEGAFTGAARGGRQGKLELANNGTLFLDELEAMPAEMQVSLLRFLEEQTVIRIGADKPRPVDVRVVGATNIDLRQLIQTGQFRADLFYRLNVCTIKIPPLRERLEDIGLLSAHILKQDGLGKTLDPDALALLERYEWPGNVRELRNVLVQAAICSAGQQILGLDIQLSDERPMPSPATIEHADLLNDAERQVILSTLNRHRGNISLAAVELNIHRVTLYRKLKRHGLNWSGKYG